MYQGEGGIYLWYIAKVVYTVCGMYHTKYDMYDAISVANEVFGAHCCSARFISEPLSS